MRDTENKLVASKSVEVTVNIYNGAATTATYTETQTVTTNLNGLISLQIGPNGTNAGWNSIQWNKARIETTVKLDGTSLGTLAMPLTAVPYALYAEYADELDPGATVVTNIYNKMRSDSLALGALIDANAANISELQGTDAALSARITADSNNLVGFKAKMKTDSATLRDLINTNAENISELQGTDAALSARITVDSNNLVIFKAKVKTDSTILANRITTDSTALVNRIVTDSTALHKAIKDTANAIRGDLNTLATTVGNITVNDPAITLKNGSTNLGSFTLNQASASEIDLSSLTPDLSNYATLSGNNTYTDTNDFTGGTTKVASGFTMGTTTTANCGNVAVNACDLLAVFDSLSNRIQGVFDSLKHLNDSLANELEALKNTIPPTADAPTIKNLTSTSLTVKANNTSSGAAITSYEYCYSTNSDMSGATCQTSALDTLDLTGLTPNTDYYVTVKATNSAGSTTSSTTTARTPTATVNNPTSVPTGFKVEVTDIDPNATTVQVCYKQGTSCSVDDNDYTCADAQTVASTENANTQAITGLTANTNYCVIVKVSNGDSTTVYGPYTVTTGDNVTLSLTSTGNGNVSLCGGTSVSATYTATPSNGTDNYTYSWNSGTAGTANTYTATYTATGSYTVTCSATHTDGYTLTATATTTVGNSGTAVTMGLCDDGLTVTVKSVSGSPNAISWGDGSTGTSVSVGTTHTYSTSATYTIIASNSAGCMATVTKAFHTTCNLSQMTTSSLLSNERGSSTAIDSVSDHEGNWYEVVQIGTQCWLKENLRTTTSPKTGTYLVNTAGKTGNSSSKLYGSKVAHWYGNDSITYAPKGYGLLYNWCAAMDTANPSSYVEVPTSSTGNNNSFSFTPPTVNHRGICPEGWHLPSDAEWNTMEDTVSGSDWQASYETSTAYRGSHAGKLSTGCDWTTSTTANAPGNYSNNERNSSGFAAVPAGGFGSSFSDAGGLAKFWTSSQRCSSTSCGNAWLRYLRYYDAGVSRNYYNKFSGFSVRCLRD